ncbi:MAG: SET domain-containing protein-lysine N-methyltransferase [Phycisphaerales bacterium]|nr:SET domain-containing protein-lysine N-methyltransferase [Phycisphaerales bacterium]
MAVDSVIDAQHGRAPPLPDGACCRVAVRDVRSGRGLFALDAASAGAAILELDGEILPTASRHSVQVGVREHLHPHRDALAAGSVDRCGWRFLNHSCDPNCWLDGLVLRARRDIASGEQLTFDYNCTEWSMASPFSCGCGTCDGAMVRGYAHIDADGRARRAAHAAPHLRSSGANGRA